MAQIGGGGRLPVTPPWCVRCTTMARQAAEAERTHSDRKVCECFGHLTSTPRIASVSVACAVHSVSKKKCTCTAVFLVNSPSIFVVGGEKKHKLHDLQK